MLRYLLFLLLFSMTALFAGEVSAKSASTDTSFSYAYFLENTPLTFEEIRKQDRWEKHDASTFKNPDHI